MCVDISGDRDDADMEAAKIILPSRSVGSLCVRVLEFREWFRIQARGHWTGDSRTGHGIALIFLTARVDIWYLQGTLKLNYHSQEFNLWFWVFKNLKYIIYKILNQLSENRKHINNYYPKSKIPFYY